MRHYDYPGSDQDFFVFRDQRDVDRWYGRCPDCGDVRSPRCHCDVPIWENPPESASGEETPIDPDIPF